MPHFHDLPRIATVFEGASEQVMGHFYEKTIRFALRKLIGDERLFSEALSDEEKAEFVGELHEQLPLMKVMELEQGHLSLFLLAPYRQEADRFFYDLVSRFLVPGKKTAISHFFATPFQLSSFDDQLYLFSHAVVAIAKPEDLETIQDQLSLIENELRLGMTSLFHAQRILEATGSALDTKSLQVQERIGELTRKRPRLFEDDLFEEMQHFLVMGNEMFKAERSTRHLVRLIYTFSYLRKAIQKELFESDKRRPLRVKLMKTQLHHALGFKQVCGVCVGIPFLSESEVFEERHLIQALEQCFPGIKPIQGSFFIHEKREEAIHTLYIEIEKERGGSFSSEEMGRLKKELPIALQRNIERLVRPIFMPRNEEEVMRNIVTLANQLRYPKDLPQVMISFDEQTERELSFTVIIPRLVHSTTPAIESLFALSNPAYRFILEKKKIVGMLRKKYPKEVAVFRVKLPDQSFVRGDQTVDFYRARKAVMSELQRLIGEVRDYNGGMISKQVELFISLKEMLEEEGKKYELLLENFFHAIFPVEMKSVLRPEPLRELFLLLLEGIEEKAPLTIRCSETKVLAVFQFQEKMLKEEVGQALSMLGIPSSQLISSFVTLLDECYLSYLYFSDDPEKQKQFQQVCSDFSKVLVQR